MDIKDTGLPLSTGQILCGTRTFKDVEPESIQRLVKNSELRVLAAGDTLFRSGDKYQQNVYVLVDGHILDTRPSGRQSTIMPGEFIGLANYLDDNDYASTALATSESRVLVVKNSLLQQLEQESPDLFNALNRVIASRLRDISPDKSITTGALAQPAERAMKSPVATCNPETTLSQAFELMKERKIGSLVVISHAHKLIGVLTYSGLAEAMVIGNARPDDSIMQVACEVPRVIYTDTPLWEAQELMSRYAVKYVIVVDFDTPVGIVSQSDILRSLVSSPGMLAHRMEKIGSLKELTGLLDQISEIAAEAQDTNYRASSAVRLLSESHLQIQRHTIRFTLDWMAQKGYGEPPVDFAVLVMGSGGRKEMLLNPDQDNGIIIADHDEEHSKAIDEWFERFCRRMVRNLHRVGYRLCPGNIMASNPIFRKSLSQWKNQIDHITIKPTEKAARWANVLFDFDTLYGNDALTSELWRHSLMKIAEEPRLLRLMAEHDSEGKPALGIFNQLVGSKKEHGKRIDIKRNGLRLISDAGRIFALQNGIAIQNTTDRFNALVRVGKISDDFRNSILAANGELLGQLLSHQIRQARSGKPIDKLIDPKKITPEARSALRMSMRAVKRLQEQMLEEFS